MENHAKFNILGVKISAINMKNALSAVGLAIKEKEKIYISVCPVSTIMECRKNAKAFESVNAADLATPDGMPVVWLGKLKGYKNIRRVYGPDLMLEICRLSERRGYKNYFYGSTIKVLSGLSENLKRTFPALVVSGTYSPPFRDLSVAEEGQAVENINKDNPDILWVGLGSPKQDIWMYRNRDKLNASAIIGVGAAFDFLSGIKPQAPKWMRGIGLEWLFRFSAEPQRLWRRYLIGNSLFICLLIAELIFPKRKFFTRIA
jgi:N-acetylglucosaminyldiphosphoundecaprenol N-acetyl-beta-D-mannosaminyltransferase